MNIIKLLLLVFVVLNAENLIEPIPEKIEYNRQKAELGKFLFFDPILSKDKSVSCAS